MADRKIGRQLCFLFLFSVSASFLRISHSPLFFFSVFFSFLLPTFSRLSWFGNLPFYDSSKKKRLRPLMRFLFLFVLDDDSCFSKCIAKKLLLRSNLFLLFYLFYYFYHVLWEGRPVLREVVEYRLDQIGLAFSWFALIYFSFYDFFVLPRRHRFLSPPLSFSPTRNRLTIPDERGDTEVKFRKVGEYEREAKDIDDRRKRKKKNHTQLPTNTLSSEQPHTHLTQKPAITLFLSAR